MTSTPAAASGAHHADAELARRAAAGDEAAFVAIMRRHNQLVYRTARGVLKSDAEAEDAAQDAWLQAWRALGSYRGDASLASWLVRIVVNQALARLRRKSASVIPLEAAMNPPLAEHDPTLATATEAAPEQAALRAQLRTLLEQRIDRLPEDAAPDDLAQAMLAVLQSRVIPLPVAKTALCASRMAEQTVQIYRDAFALRRLGG